MIPEACQHIESLIEQKFVYRPNSDTLLLNFKYIMGVHNRNSMTWHVTGKYQCSTNKIHSEHPKIPGFLNISISHYK